MDIKCETLMSLTAFVQQRDTFGSAESNKLVDSLVQQGLLTEHPMGTPQLHAKWSNATQQWLDTLLGLISNAQSTKSQLACQLASASLTGCSTSLFVNAYNGFVTKAVDIVRKQPPAETSWTHPWPVITAVFNRIEQLLNLPGLRRDASSLVPKLMAALQPTFAIAENEAGKGVVGGWINSELLKALNAGVQALPTAFRAHQKALGAFATALLAAPLANIAVKQEAALLYSLLPRLSGDAETWSSYVQNALCACHARLDVAYLGMEDSIVKMHSKAALDPQAQPLTTPSQSSDSCQGRTAGQQGKVTGQSVHSMGAVETALEQLAGFLDILERMLTLSFPVAVPIPAHGILLLLTRILSMDDAARQAGHVPPSASAYLVLLAALPALHICALQLLQTLLWAGQGALLLHHASMAKLLSTLLRQVAASAASDLAPAALQFRQQVYRTAGELVARGGIGVTSLLGPEAIKCALLELYGSKQSKKRPAEEGPANGHPSKKQKKSKRDEALPSLDAMLADGSGAAPAAGTDQQASIGLTSSSAGPQEAALHLLANLTQAWGGSMLHQQRSQIDAIAAHMASTAGLAVEQMSQCFEGSSSQASTIAVQLAALRALLASVLCPASHRPLFLPQALALFTQALTSPAPQIAAFSRQALLALEGIIHPRSGPTMLHPHPPTANGYAPNSTSTSSEQGTELGMPKLWSAVMPPAQPKPQQQPAIVSEQAVTETGVSHDAAGTAAACEVLKAGQVYGAAVAKLEAALRKPSTAASQLAAAEAGIRTEDVNRHSGEQQRSEAPRQGLSSMADIANAVKLTSGAAAKVTAATPAGEVSPGIGQPAVSASETTIAPTGLQAPVGVSVHRAGNCVLQSGAGVAGADAQSQSDGMLEENDGYIRLEPTPSPAVTTATLSEQQAVVQGATAGLLSTAESSDSQGSLPDIDSGESSDSSAME